MIRLNSLIFLLILGPIACGPNKNIPEYVAKQYLEALKNKDWEKAKSYTTKEGAANLDMMKSLGTDFGLTEVKDIECKIYNKNEAICNFCCSDSDFYCIDLRRGDDRKWFVFMPKDGGCRGPGEDLDTNTSDTL